MITQRHDQAGTMTKPTANETQPRPIMGAALLHPLCGVGMALWWLNDHLLKRHTPGVLSGKLSDVACLAVFPVFVWCLIDGPARWLFPRGYAREPQRRLGAFFVTTSLVTAWFVVINVSVAVGDVHRQIWVRAYATLTSFLASLGVQWHAIAHHTVDPTDLLTLPGLFVAWYVVNASITGDHGIRCSPTPDPSHAS